MRDAIARAVVFLVERLLLLLLALTDSRSATVSAVREGEQAARVCWSMTWSDAADRLWRAFAAAGHDVCRATLADVAPADLSRVLRVVESAARVMIADHEARGCTCEDGCVIDRLQAALAELRR